MGLDIRLNWQCVDNHFCVYSDGAGIYIVFANRLGNTAEIRRADQLCKTDYRHYFYKSIGKYILISDNTSTDNDNSSAVYLGFAERQQTEIQRFFQNSDIPTMYNIANFVFADYEKYLLRQRYC